MPLDVSVVIPCFNHAQYLPEAIESALNQSYLPAEVIVIDDGSTDPTPEVAAQYQNCIKYIRQNNRGLSAARNAGIRQAKGDLITFLDADDLWLQGFIKALIPLFDQPNVGATYCGSQFIDPTGKLLPQKQTIVISPGKFQDYLLDGNFLPVHSVLIRHKVFDKIGGFDETLTALEDYDMWLRISRHYFFLGRPDVLALTRVCPDSMSADPDRMASQEQALICKHFPQKNQASSEDRIMKARLQGNAELRVAIASLNRCHCDKVIEHLTSAFTIHPSLVSKLDTYYELLMAGLPRGKKISSELNNLNQAVSQAALILTELFSKQSNSFSRLYPASMASLLVASGQIAYPRREMTLARRYFLQSLKTNLWVSTAGHSLTFLLKSFLAPSVLSRIHHFK